MHKDEWGMLVNAPAPAGQAGAAVEDLPKADAPPTDFLLPGEVLLWQGAPREGAGWRCLLRDADIQRHAVGLAVFAVLGGLVEDTYIVPIGVALLLLAVAGIMLAVTSRKLRQSRYAVTDRRAIVLRGTTIESVHHGATDPERHETRCGTTITIGRGTKGNHAAVRRERAKGWLARLVWGPSDSDPQIVFRALDPKDTPFDLLRSLAAMAGPRFRPIPPIPGGFPQ